MYKKRKCDTEYNEMGSVTESETGIIKEFESSPNADVNSASSGVGSEITNSDQTLDDVKPVCVKVETDEWYNAAAGLYSACAKSTNGLQEEKHHDENNKDGYHLVHEQSEKTGCLEMDQDVCTSADVKAEQTGHDIRQQDVTRQAGFNSVCFNRKQTPDLNVHQNVHPVFETAKQSVNPNTEQRNITRNGLSSVCGIKKQYINTNTDKETVNDPPKFANIYSIFVMRDQTQLSTGPQYFAIPTNTNYVGVQIEKMNHYCKRYVSMDLKCEKEKSVQQQNPQMESVSHGQVAFGQVKTTANYLPTRSSGSGSLFLNMLATTSANQCPPCANSTYVPTNMNAETSNEETSSTHQLSPSDISKDVDDKLLLAGWYALPSKNDELLENSNVVVKSGEYSSDDFEKIFIERNTGIRKSSDSTLTVCDPGSSSSVVEPRGAPVRDTIASVNSKEMSTTANRFKPLCKDDGNFDQPLEKDVELERFFTKQELDKMTFHEQKRLKKIVKNYEIMCDMGLPAIKPDFMKGHAYQAKAAETSAARNCNMNVDKSVSDSKEDLTPDMERKKQTKGDELLIWYGDEYAKELGLIRDKNLLFRPKYVNGEEIYQCVYCKTAFTTAIPCVRHLRKMHGGDKLTQDDLQVLDQWLQENDQYNNSSDMKTNMGIYTEERLYKCEVCGDACNQSYILKKHMRIHTGERPYKCEVCGYECNRSYNLKIHMRKHTGQKRFMCEVCGYVCANSSTLKTHMRMHTGESLFKCEVCGYACNQRFKLKTHMRKHAGERQYKCDVCGNEFNRRGTLKTHMRIHTGERPYKCEVCGYACYRSGSLKTHMRTHTGERKYMCEVCGYAFTTSDALKTHIRTHTGERLFKCEVCGYAFTQSGSLKTHMRKHTGERPYKCEVCGYACNQKGNLKSHIKIHTGERPYTCDVCDNTFNERRYLVRHAKMHAGECLCKCEVCGYVCKRSGNLEKHMMVHTGERPYKCDVCGYACNQSGTLKTHMRRHTGEKPCTCEVCGYVFNQSCALKKHMRIHTGERRYTCEVCGYACNDSGILRKHMRIHTGERLYMCEVSGNAFNKSDALKTHIRTHTGERLFKCELCGNAFTQKGTLKTHMRTHTGERPYTCEVCGYACNQKGNLKAHLKIHTGERPYKCDMCGYACNHSSSLMRHLKIHAGESLCKCKVCGYVCNQGGDLKKHMKIHTGETVQV